MKTQKKAKQRKLLIKSLFLVTMLFFFGACQKDDITEDTGEGKAKFGFSDVSEDFFKSGEADVSAIILSIEDENGVLIYNQEALPLLNMNGNFITRTISLKTGNYFLTEFIVIDSAGNVIYLTPMAGSLKSHLVSEPLPIFFSIIKDEVTQLAPEVVSVDNSTPEDFGYTTFTFNVVETLDFLMGVLVYNDDVNNFELTTADLTVNAGGQIIFENVLAAETNFISLPYSYSNYTLIVQKTGYEAYENTFTREELELYFHSSDNGPLMVTLEEADTDLFGTLTDIDGNVYTTVIIGTQEWMAENLKTTMLNDGTAIANVTSGSQWGSYDAAAYAWQNNDFANKDIYGALYNYKAVETGNLCPAGWRVPTDNDWSRLTNYVGSSNTGNILKSCNQADSPLGGECATNMHPRWDANSTNYGTDEFGFAALPGGFRNEVGSFGGYGSHGFWWSSTLVDNEYPIRRSLRSNTSTINRSWGGQQVGFSVRCVKE